MYLKCTDFTYFLQLVYFYLQNILYKQINNKSIFSHLGKGPEKSDPGLPGPDQRAGLAGRQGSEDGPQLQGRGPGAAKIQQGTGPDVHGPEAQGHLQCCSPPSTKGTLTLTSKFIY